MKHLIIILLFATVSLFAETKDTVNNTFGITYGKSSKYSTTNIISLRLADFSLEYGQYDHTIKDHTYDYHYYSFGWYFPLYQEYLDVNVFAGPCLWHHDPIVFDKKQEISLLYGAGLSIYPFKNILNVGITWNNIFDFNWKLGLIFKM